MIHQTTQRRRVAVIDTPHRLGTIRNRSAVLLSLPADAPTYTSAQWAEALAAARVAALPRTPGTLTYDPSAVPPPPPVAIAPWNSWTPRGGSRCSTDARSASAPASLADEIGNAVSAAVTGPNRLLWIAAGLSAAASVVYLFSSIPQNGRKR
jgi:hypothetical protein